MKKSKSLFLIVFAGIFFAMTMPSYAYLDPGTGSLILQGIIASIAGIAITLKLNWHRLLRFFGLRKGDISESDNKKNEK